MNTIKNTEEFSLLNIRGNIDPMLAEREIRAAAQQALASAIIRTIKVGYSNIAGVLSDVSEMRKKYNYRSFDAV